MCTFSSVFSQWMETHLKYGFFFLQLLSIRHSFEKFSSFFSVLAVSREGVVVILTTVICLLNINYYSKKNQFFKIFQVWNGSSEFLENFEEIYFRYDLNSHDL